MTTRRRRRLRYALAASTAALILAGGLVEPRGTDLQASLGERGHLSVGSWRIGGSLWSLATAQGQTVTLENVTFSVAPTTYRIPKIVFEGTTASRAELAALFDPKAAEPAQRRLAKLSAARVSIPEIVIEQKTAEGSTRFTYRDVRAEGVAAGRIASGTGESAAFEVKEGDEVALTGGHGRSTFRDIDLAAIARVYNEAATGPAAELTTLYGHVAVENLTFSDDETATFRIGRVAMSDVRARPTSTPWGELSKAMAEVKTGDDAPKEDQAKAMRLMSEMFDAMAVGSAEMTDIVATSEDDKDTRVAIPRIAYGDGETRVEGFAITSPEGSLRLGLLSFRGFSFGSIAEGMARLAGKSESEMTAADLRSLVPTLGTTRMADLAIDFPSTSRPDDPRQRSRVGIREVAIEPGPQRNGIPTSLRVGVANFTADLTADLQEGGLKPLADLGYQSVDVSWAAALSWKEDSRTLAVDEFAFTGRDIGRVNLRASAGNVGPDVFDPDSAVALVALLGAAAQSLEITVQDAGLYERHLAQEAKAKRKTVQALRTEYAAGATLGIPLALGGSPQARTLGETIGKFLARPGTLRVAVTPKDPRGLGATELMGAGDPLALLQAVDVKATLE